MVLIDKQKYTSREEQRLQEDRDRVKYWKRWGPYVAERQWATGMFFWAPSFIFTVFFGRPMWSRSV
jgi:hypothetical protein